MPEAKLITIIDDDASVAKATGRLVRSLGFGALTFTSAQDFLLGAQRGDCLHRLRVQILMTGLDLYEFLAAQGSRIPIIFITSFSTDRVRQRTGGAVCILHKPFDASELAMCLNDAVRSS